MSEYITGIAALTLIAAPIGWAAVRLRSRSLEGWTGASALLAEIVIAQSMLLLIAQVLGAAGTFRRIPIVLACLAVGGAVGLASTRVSRRPGRPGPSTQSAGEDLIARTVAISAAGGVSALWLYRTSQIFSGGITEWDSLWYHLPYAARWVQLGSLTQLHNIGNPAGTFLPVNGEVFHALGMAAFGHDALSPLLNLLWLALLLLAAWCVGEAVGRPQTGLTLGALVMGLRIMQESQPGTANVDVAGLALMLAALAFVIHEPRRPFGFILSGAAIGLIAGTKLGLLPVAAALAGVLIIRVPSGSRRVIIPASAAAALTGTFWFARNFMHVGNPLPWMQMSIGPIGFRRLRLEPVDCGVTTVLDYAGTPAVWVTWFVPGLRWAFGPLWWVLLMVGLGAALLALVRPSSNWVRALGGGALLGWIGYLVTPASAGGFKVPHCFSYNLRFFVPALTLSLLVACLAVPIRYSRLVTIALAVVFVATSAGANTGGQAAVLVGLTLAAAVVWYDRHPHMLKALPRGRTIAAIGLLLTVLAGIPATDAYLARRYNQVSFQQAIGKASTWARGIDGARIAVAGLAMHYPLYGLHGTNVVEYVTAPMAGERFARPADCDAWREALTAGGFDYVVTGATIGEAEPPEAEWTRRDDRAREVLRDGPTTVFALDRANAPARCASP